MIILSGSEGDAAWGERGSQERPALLLYPRESSGLDLGIVLDLGDLGGFNPSLPTSGAMAFGWDFGGAGSGFPAPLSLASSSLCLTQTLRMGWQAHPSARGFAMLVWTLIPARTPRD